MSLPSPEVFSVFNADTPPFFSPDRKYAAYVLKGMLFVRSLASPSLKITYSSKVTSPAPNRLSIRCHIEFSADCTHLLYYTMPNRSLLHIFDLTAAEGAMPLLLDMQGAGILTATLAGTSYVCVVTNYNRQLQIIDYAADQSGKILAIAESPKLAQISYLSGTVLALLREHRQDMLFSFNAQRSGYKSVHFDLSEDAINATEILTLDGSTALTIDRLACRVFLIHLAPNGQTTDILEYNCKYKAIYDNLAPRRFIADAAAYRGFIALVMSDSVFILLNSLLQEALIMAPPNRLLAHTESLFVEKILVRSDAEARCAKCSSPDVHAQDPRPNSKPLTAPSSSLAALRNTAVHAVASSSSNPIVEGANILPASSESTEPDCPECRRMRSHMATTTYVALERNCIGTFNAKMQQHHAASAASCPISHSTMGALRAPPTKNKATVHSRAADVSLSTRLTAQHIDVVENCTVLPTVLSRAMQLRNHSKRIEAMCDDPVLDGHFADMSLIRFSSDSSRVAYVAQQFPTTAIVLDTVSKSILAVLTHRAAIKDMIFLHRHLYVATDEKYNSAFASVGLYGILDCFEALFDGTDPVMFKDGLQLAARTLMEQLRAASLTRLAAALPPNPAQSVLYNSLTDTPQDDLRDNNSLSFSCDHPDDLCVARSLHSSRGDASVEAYSASLETASASTANRGIAMGYLRNLILAHRMSLPMMLSFLAQLNAGKRVCLYEWPDGQSARVIKLPPDLEFQPLHSLNRSLRQDALVLDMGSRVCVLRV